jgi:hypothetical protein
VPAINVVQTSDEYDPSGATLEGVAESSGGFYNVQDADVFCEVEYGDRFEQDWTDEVHIAAGTVGVLPQGVIGIRFRSYVADAPASVTAALFLRDQPAFQIGAGSPVPPVAAVTSVFNVRTFGAKGAGVGDDTAAIVDAITAAAVAGGGIVYFPEGSYPISSTITLPFASLVILLGAGADSSELIWSTDLGSGNYAVKWGPFGDWQNNTPYEIRGLHLVGPDGTGSPSGAQLGTVSAEMGGVQLERQCRLIDCKVEGFYSGVSKYGNHQQILGCYLRNNYINLDYPDLLNADPMIGQNYGDETVQRSSLTAARFANVSVGDNQGIVTALYERNEIGFSPYHLHAKTGRATGNFISESVFVDNNFEAFGNAFIWAEDAATVDVIFRTLFHGSVASQGGDGPSATFFNTYKITSRGQTYAVRLWAIDTVRVQGAATPWSFPGTVAVIQVNQVNGLELEVPFYFSNYGTYGLPLVDPISAASTVAWATNRVYNEGQVFRFGNPGTNATTQGELFFYGGSENIVGLTTGNPPAGVCFETTSAPGTNIHRCLFQTTGDVTVVADAAVSASQIVKGAAAVTAGRVLASTSASNLAMGYALAAAAGAGSSLLIRLRGLE